jgi:hypothetical protein
VFLFLINLVCCYLYHFLWAYNYRGYPKWCSAWWCYPSKGWYLSLFSTISCTTYHAVASPFFSSSPYVPPRRNHKYCVAGRVTVCRLMVVVVEVVVLGTGALPNSSVSFLVLYLVCQHKGLRDCSGAVSFATMHLLAIHTSIAYLCKKAICPRLLVK